MTVRGLSRRVGVDLWVSYLTCILSVAGLIKQDAARQRGGMYRSMSASCAFEHTRAASCEPAPRSDVVASQLPRVARC